ncbi:MAG: putative rane protein [Micavibrio sp.]|nr:putative rane protein [Micavibrio sp.]
MVMKKIILALVLLLLPALPAQAQEAKAPHVKITLTPERSDIRTGEGLWVLIEETIEPGWHTYWINPGDSGAAPRIKWTMPKGFETSDIKWSAPHKINLEGLTSYGYEGKAVLAQSILAPVKDMPKGKLEFRADFEILVCKDICIPEMVSQTITLNDPAVKETDSTEAVDAFFNSLPTRSDWYGTYRFDGPDFVATIYGLEPSAINFSTLSFIPVEWGIVKNAATVKTSVITEPKQALQIVQARDDRDLKDMTKFTAILSFAGMDGKQNDLEIPLRLDTTPLATLDSALKKNTDAQPVTAPDVKTTLLQAMIFALFGGLILNLMPCVFPILSIKALSLIKLRDKGAGFAAMNGIAYTLGVLATFAGIGGLLMGVKIAGGDIGWGFQLQNPAIVLGLSYLLFGIGLNLSGMFDINSSFIGVGASFANKHGFAGSFFTGVLATVVATPCTAPFMAGALGYALVQPPVVAMAVFLALGLGLALPYLLLSVVPGLAALLPRPGLWMVKFRQFLAFPVYASAAWLLWVLSLQSGTGGLLWALMGLVAIAFALWLLAHKPVRKTRRCVIILIALAAIAFAAVPFMDRGLLRKTVESAAQEVPAYSAEKLETLLKGDEPIFVYMTASWCITCKVNERIALNTDATRALIRDNKITVLEGDWTNMNPEITAFLKSYDRAGVPLYIYYGPRDAGGQRPAPVVLPQILTPGLMAETFQRK